MHTSLVANRNITPKADHVMLSKTDFRHAMSRLGAAVNIITTNGPAGCAGFTASAVCSVTDEPPTLLVCLNRSASVYETFKGNGVLCVNVLGAGHQDISNLFGGKTPMDQRFAAGHWTTGLTESPVLEDASVSFDCRLSQITEVGTHDILICEVISITVSEEARSLIYFNRQYHELSVD
jgi:flavin reductase